MLKKISSVITLLAIGVLNFSVVSAATGSTSAANDLFSTSTSTSAPTSTSPTTAPTSTTGGNDLFGGGSATATSGSTTAPTSGSFNTDASAYQKASNASSSSVLEITVDETKPGSFFVKGTLKAPSPISIKKAFIALKYDQSVFDIKAFNVKYAENGFALPVSGSQVDIKTDSTDPSMGIVSFGALTQDAFTNNPQGKILFVAAFTKKEGTTLSAKSYFTVDNKSSFILDPSEKQLLSDEPVRVPASKTLATTNTETPVTTTVTPTTVTATPISTTPSGIPVVASSGATNTGTTASVNTGAAKDVKTGAFENMLVAIAFMILAGVFYSKRKNEVLG